MKVTRRQLAVQFVKALGSQPTGDLAKGLVGAALEAGYSRRDLSSLFAAVERELLQQHGVVEVKLTTAHDLPETTLQQIAREVSRLAGAKDFTTTHSVDSDLLGGFEAEAGGVAVRNSIRTQLNSGVMYG